MGNCCKGCLARSKSEDNALLLLIVGLQNTGKTEIAHKISHLVRNDYLQTKGCRVFNTSIEGSSVQITEIGGAPEFVDIWKYYFLDMHGIIFVIDATSIDNICQSYKVFKTLMAHDFLIGKPFLIIANKQDLPGSVDCIDICDYLDVEFLANKYRNPCMIEACGNWDSSSNEYDGLLFGITWLIKTIQLNKQFLENRINFHRVMLEESHKLFERHRPYTGVRRKRSRFSIRSKRPKTAPSAYPTWINTNISEHLSEHSSLVYVKNEKMSATDVKPPEPIGSLNQNAIPAEIKVEEQCNETKDIISIKDEKSNRNVMVLNGQNNEDLTVEDLSLHSVSTNKTINGVG